MSLARLARLRSGPLAILAVAGLLAGCLAAPRLPDGLPADVAWLVFPIEDWAAVERGEPEGIAACLSDDCPDKLMVSVLTLRGEAAQEARAVLADPSRLAAFISTRDREDENEDRRRIATRVETRPIEAGGLSGFLVTLAGEGGRGRTAYGATLARPAGRELRLALVVGDDEAAVEAAVRQVAQEAL